MLRSFDYSFPNDKYHRRDNNIIIQDRLAWFVQLSTVFDNRQKTRHLLLHVSLQSAVLGKNLLQGIIPPPPGKFITIYFRKK